MNDAARMQVAKSIEQLAHNLNNLRFGNCILLQVSKQLPAVHLLHHYIHPALVLVKFFCLDYVLMRQQTHNLNFVPQELLFLLVQFCFVNPFKGVVDVALFALGLEHF